jgi:glycosyltransferase involved in cell wall biosynthesis
LRITHFIYDHPANPWVGGGGAVRAVTVNAILASRGHHITMVCGGYSGAPPQTTESGYTLVHTPNTPTYTKSRLAYALHCRKILKTSPTDLIVDDTSAYNWSMPYLASRAPRIAIVHHFFGSHVFRKTPFIGLFAFVFERLNLRAYQYFLVGSNSTESQLRLLRGPKAVIANIAYGIDESMFGLSCLEGNYILYFGRLDVYNKGLDTLLDAFELLKSTAPTTRLVIAGGGAGFENVRELVQNHPRRHMIELTGRVTEERKKELFAHALIVCMPSRFEGWGIVALEAAACAKAVVGTDIPGLRDAVINNHTGLLVPKDSPGKLSEAITTLVTDSALRQSIGTAALNRAQTFRWQAIAIQQEQFYREVIKSSTLP